MVDCEIPGWIFDVDNRQFGWMFMEATANSAAFFHQQTRHHVNHGSNISIYQPLIF